MVDVLRPLRVNALELLRQPGAERAVVDAIAGEPLGVVHHRLRGDVDIDLVLTSMNDGIVVTGTIGIPWATQCRRCLKDLRGTIAADTNELYQIDIVDPEAFQIENNQLDLTAMVREVAMLSLDDERVCRDDCAGLCQSCGVDLNSNNCDCDTTVTDHRWAALDGLVLDD